MTLDTAQKQLPELVRSLLDKVPTLSLATVDAVGRPHAANVNFVADKELNLLFLSRVQSAHSLHIHQRPDVAVTVYAPFESTSQIRGVQLHGKCEKLAAVGFDARWRLFCSKHTAAAAMEATVRRERAFYRVQPHWLRWIDNSVHFGFNVESKWPPG